MLLLHDNKIAHVCCCLVASATTNSCAIYSGNAHNMIYMDNQLQDTTVSHSSHFNSVFPSSVKKCSLCCNVFIQVGLDLYIFYSKVSF